MALISSHIFRNLGYMAVAQVAAGICGFFTLVVLSRALGPANFGILGFGTAVLAFVGLLTTLGTDQYGAREISRAEGPVGRICARLVGLRLVLAAVSYLALLAFAAWGNRGSTEADILMIQGTGVFVTALTLDFIFQGMRRLEWVAVRQIATAAIVLAAAFFLVHGAGDLYAAAWIYPIAGAAVVIVVLVAGVRRVIAFRLDGPAAGLGTIMSAVVPIAVSGTMQAVILNTDVVMLGLFRDNEEVGLYTAIMRLVLFALMPAGLVVAAMFPELARKMDSPTAMRDGAKQFATLLLFIGFPLPCLVLIVPEQTVGLIYGESFMAATAVVAPMMSFVLIIYLRMIFGTPLVAWNMERQHMKLSILAAVTNVVLNAALIPSYGMLGAVAASLASQVVAMLGYGWVFRRHVGELICRVPFMVALCAGGASLVTMACLSALDARLGGIHALAYLAIAGTVFGWSYLAGGYFLVRPLWRQD